MKTYDLQAILLVKAETKATSPQAARTIVDFLASEKLTWGQLELCLFDCTVVDVQEAIGSGSGQAGEGQHGP